MWTGDGIYFLSDRDRTMNMFVYNTTTRTTTKVTDFTDYDIKFPSTNGSLIVFENAGYIYKFDPADKKAEKVNITLTSDNIYARSETKNADRYVRAASLSPDGKRVAVTARGEVFDLPAENGVTRNITRSPGAHERSAAYSPDGTHIAYISDATGANFSPYGGDVAQSIDTYDDFEVYLSETGSLYMQKYSSFSATQVDSSVLDWAVINDTIYYLSGTEDAMTLKSFDVDNLLWSTIAQPTNLYPQLTASNGKLFVLTKNNQICTVNTSDGSMQNFASLPTLDSYATSSGKDLESYRIEAVSGQLNIYGVVSRTDVLPTFTFVESTSQYVADTSTEMILLSAYKIQDEETVSDLLVPAEQYSTLRRGSRGDAVSAIQQPLYDLGYYDYYIDGIYGWRTERAVKLAQAELG